MTVPRLMLFALPISLVAAATASASDAPATRLFSILSIPASMGEPVRADADVAFISDGFRLGGCKVIRSSGDLVADSQACKTLSYRAASKPTQGKAPVWITPPVRGNYVPPRAPNPAAPVTASDYPTRSLRFGEQGTVIVRVDVGADGAVTGCAVAASSGYSRLDDAARRNICGKLNLLPATMDGKPIASINLTRVTFYLGN